MELDWIDVPDSSRVKAMAYDSESESIFTRFRDGTEWQYEGCPLHVWEAFTADGVSKGAFISSTLDHHVNHRYVN